MTTSSSGIYRCGTNRTGPPIKTDDNHTRRHKNPKQKRGKHPKPYAPRLAWDSTLLSNYILLTVIVGSRSAHTRQVVAIRRKLACQVAAAYFAQPNSPATSIADNIRAITMPLMEFPNAT